MASRWMCGWVPLPQPYIPVLSRMTRLGNLLGDPTSGFRVPKILGRGTASFHDSLIIWVSILSDKACEMPPPPHTSLSPFGFGLGSVVVASPCVLSLFGSRTHPRQRRVTRGAWGGRGGVSRHWLSRAEIFQVADLFSSKRAIGMRSSPPWVFTLRHGV